MTAPYYSDDLVKTCECGCGSPVRRRFVSGHNGRGQIKSAAHRAAISAAQTLAWATTRSRKPLGSTRIDSHGYRLVKMREGDGSWPKEHIVVMEAAIGRGLRLPRARRRTPDPALGRREGLSAAAGGVHNAQAAPPCADSRLLDEQRHPAHLKARRSCIREHHLPVLRRSGLRLYADAGGRDRIMTLLADDLLRGINAPESAEHPGYRLLLPAEADRLGWAEVWGDYAVRIAVPFEMHRLGKEFPSVLAILGEKAARVLAELGANLMFGRPDDRLAARAMDALVVCLAVAALISDDGATYHGMHWCSKRHRGCPNG